MPQNQAITPHPNHGRSASNICLHLGPVRAGRGHLEQDPYKVKYRMGGVKWPAGDALLNVRLKSVEHPVVRIVGHNPESDWHPFAICPYISKTIISEDVSDQFGLGAGINQMIPCNIPILDMLGWIQIPPLVSVRTVNVSIEVECLTCIDPQPIINYEREFEILIVQRGRVSPNLAILGRDVLQHMLLLYQGQTLPHLQTNPPGPGWMYYGKNDRHNM